MNQKQYFKLIKLEPIYFLNKTSKLVLDNSYAEIGEEKFIAVGFEKSKAAKKTGRIRTILISSSTPTEILEYPIGIDTLLQTSIFKLNPFEIYRGKVTIDGLIVTLESK